MENLVIPSDLIEPLFELQAEDLLLGQLEHKIKNLPEREKLLLLKDEEDKTEKSISGYESERLELTKKEKRLDLELSSIETRLLEVDEKLYSGLITTEKEAKSLQDEIVHLKERQDVLESELLETLTMVEEACESIERSNSLLETQKNDIQNTESDLNAAEGELGEKVSQAKTRRVEIVEKLTEEILSSYETYRRHFPSDAVVRFDGPTCNGCHLTMSAMEADRIKGLESGSVSECPECGRLVVR